KVLNVRVNSSFNQVKYNVQAQNKDLDEILKDTVKRIPLITLNTTARGGWNDIAWGFDSNLGSELSNGIKRNIQARIDAKVNALKAQVDQKIKAQKDQLMAQFNKIKGQVDKETEKAQKQVASAKQQAESDMNAKKQRAENSKKKEIEDAGKKLLKGLGL
ncbi:MAG: hypothetical protein KDD50_15485, partial [Bdellovibrionales bacterium]|nr:hypothetical protein [Bdellovibrionales bacterium]